MIESYSPPSYGWIVADLGHKRAATIQAEAEPLGRAAVCDSHDVRWAHDDRLR